MLGSLTVVVPLGLAGAISPVMLTQQTLLLAGRDGRRMSAYYAAGVALVLLVFLGLVVTFGERIRLPVQPHLSASLDLLLGAILVVISRLVFLAGRYRRPKPAQPRRAAPRRGVPALAYGVFSMATNPTTLALLTPAGKEIAGSQSGPAGRVVLIVVVAVLAGTPAWLPIALIRIAPLTGRRTLDGLRALIARRGRKATVAAFAVAGLFFLVRGTARLITG